MNKFGKIYICATPIGNLGDASSRLKQVLSDVDCIYCEDTRVTKKLLSAFDIKAMLKRLDENNMQDMLEELICYVKEGNNIAYCSDAGMPGVSDPGLRLVNKAYKNNIDVEVLPGPSAAINAYVLSGFCSSEFYFGGFLSKKNAERKQQIAKYSSLNAVQIYYESPNRLVSTLKSFSEVLPNRQIAVCREITKIHEEVLRGTAQNLIDELSSRDAIKGEIVIVVDCAGKDEILQKIDVNKKVAINICKELSSLDVSTKDIVRILTNTLELSKNDAYDIALEVGKRG